MPTLHVSIICKGFNSCLTTFFKIVKIHYFITIFGFSKKNAFIGKQTSLLLVHWFLVTNCEFQKLSTNFKSFLVNLLLGYIRIALTAECDTKSGADSMALTSSKSGSLCKHTRQERLAKPGSLAGWAPQRHSGVQPSHPAGWPMMH